MTTDAPAAPQRRPSAADVISHDPLAPLRDALQEAARRDRDAMVAQAEQDAEQALAQGRREAEQILQRARDEGERDAEQLRVEQRARALRRARSIVLSTQRDILDQLRHRARRAAGELWADPRTHAVVRDRMVARAHADLGPAARIVDHPDGGIVATTDHARATYLVADLADRVVDSLGSELEGLWTP